MIKFKEELKKLAEDGLKLTHDEMKNDFSFIFESFSKDISKFLKRQAAANFHIEEIQDTLSEMKAHKEKSQKEMGKALEALIGIADLIEAFYLFCEESQDLVMLGQAKVMWNTCLKTMTAAGMTRISDEGSPVNAAINTVAGVLSANGLPNGQIIKVIKSGYLYKGKLIRKSVVIVNKSEVANE